MLVGLTMIILSLAFQLMFYVILLFPTFVVMRYFGFNPEGRAATFIPILCYALLFNSVSCFEYFRRRVANVGIGDASHFFLLPRGIDRLLTGRDVIAHRTEV